MEQNERIREVIIVEGRDDTAAVRRAVDAETIETHGFGISDVTWDRIARAAAEQGIIIFTDPDHAGEVIRRRILQRFPDAAQAFLDRDEARSGGEIGIEHASPQSIRRALAGVRTQLPEAAAKQNLFTEEDLWRAGLAGVPGAAVARRRTGKILGIGYGNVVTFLRRLNRYGITREEFYEAIQQQEPSNYTAQASVPHEEKPGSEFPDR